MSRYVGRVTFTPGAAEVPYDVDVSPPTASEARAGWRPTIYMERVSRWAAMQPGAFSKEDAEGDVTGSRAPIRHAVDVLLDED